MNSEETTYDFKKLKTFHIPRKKEGQSNKDILTDLPTQSREFTHTLYPGIKSSFLYPNSSRRLKIEKVELVHNPVLQKEFLEKKKDLKDEGRTEKELAESFGYLYVTERAEAEKICENGVEIGNTGLVSLGKPLMGVYMCKHADVVSPTNFSNNDNGFIVVFKIIKGKTKAVTEGRGVSTNMEPTPLYDCHVTKLTTDPSKTSHIRAFQALQYYIYEYGDVDVRKRPRQIIPHAVLHIKYSEFDNTLLRKESVSSADGVSETVEPSQPSKTTSLDQEAFALWRGKLSVKGGLSCIVKLLSDVDTAVNVAFLDIHINVKNMIPMDKFTRLLPQTLLNRTGKKHNVIYRGRSYNIFTLMPEDDNGMGKFRQLIAHLVQCNAVATIPLHFSSWLYLIPKCQLTVDRMGLQAFENNDLTQRNQFLYAVIVTPKSLTSKVNDQKLYNMLHVRKKKDGRTDIPEELEQKLMQMNIDPNSIGSLQPDQIEKLTGILKDKKRLQISEKLLPHHYKDAERLLSSSKDHNIYSGKVGSLWSTTCQLRENYYAPRTKKKSAAKVEKPTKVASVVEEATFSDEEGVDIEIPTVVTKPTPTLLSNDPRSRSHSQDGMVHPRVNKRKNSSDSASKESVPAKIVRPSFKPLEEILCKSGTTELLLHPDFVLSERYDKTHVVIKERGFGVEPDIERSDQISIIIRQNVPFSSDKDCPYACDGDPVIKSMLRAVYGPWEGDGDVNLLEDREKVLWVRQILHLHKNRSSPETRMFSGRMQDRKIVEDGIMSIQDSSPLSAPGGSSSDSGFTSSSTAATPTTSQHVSSPSALREIASFLASALPKTTDETNTDAQIQETAHNFLKVFANTVDKGENSTPDLKSIMETVTEQQKRQASNVDMLSDGSPMEMGTPSPEAPDQRSDPSGHPQNSKAQRSQSFDRPQDPRLSRRSALSHHPLSLPTYRFPPSKIASIDLPNDAEVTLGRPPTITVLPTTTTSSNTPRNMMISALPNDPYKIPKQVTGFGMKGGKKKKGFRPMRGASFSLHKVLKAPLLRSFLNPMAGPKTIYPSVIRSTGTSAVPHLLSGAVNDLTRKSLDHRSVSRNTHQTPTTEPGSTRTSEKSRHASEAHPTLTPTASGGGSLSRIKPKTPENLPLIGAGSHLSKNDLISILQCIGLSSNLLQESSTLKPSEDPHPSTPAHPQEGIKDPQNISEISGGGVTGSAPINNQETFPIKTVTAKTLSSKNILSLNLANSSSSNVTVSAVVGRAALSDAKFVTQTSVSPNLISVTLASEIPARSSAQTIVTKSLSSTAQHSSEQLEETQDSTSQSSLSSSSSSSPPLSTFHIPSMSREDILRIREKMKKAKQKKQEAMKQIKMDKMAQKKLQGLVKKQGKTKPDAEKGDISCQKPASEAKGGQVLSQHEQASTTESGETAKLSEHSLNTRIQTSERSATASSTKVTKADPNAMVRGAESQINSTRGNEKHDSVVVLSEIDKILSEVKRDKTVNTTEALSDRLLQLALQLRNTNSPITATSANTITVDAAELKVRPSSVQVRQVSDNPISTLAPTVHQNTSIESQRTGTDMPIDVSTKVFDQNTLTDCEQQMALAKPVAQGMLVASVQPTMTVIPPRDAEWNPANAQSSATTGQEDIPTEDIRDTATPTLDDTYNPMQETMLQNSFRKTYHNFTPLSEVSKRHLGHNRKASSALDSVLREVKEFEASIQLHPKPPLGSIDHKQDLQTTANPHKQHSSITESGFQPSKSFTVKRSVAHVYPQPATHLGKVGPPFYVFDPRGNPHCDAIVTYLRRINGVPYHLHRVTEVLASIQGQEQQGVIGITVEILNRSLPAGKLWIVIRSADLALLPSMPYLSMLKCAGPRVQFVQADTLDDVKSRRYQHIMSGEHGIILPVSTDVIIDNPLVFAKIVHWMVQTRKYPPEDGKPLKNTWRMAMYNHIQNELHAASDARWFEDEHRRKAASSLIHLLQEHSSIVINLLARDQYSSVVTESDIVETAMELQHNNLQYTRHIVVLTGHDHESPQWRRLRRAGVAVATLDQFVQSIKQAKHDGNTCQYSPLLGIYSTEIA